MITGRIHLGEIMEKGKEAKWTCRQQQIPFLERDGFLGPPSDQLLLDRYITETAIDIDINVADDHKRITIFTTKDPNSDSLVTNVQCPVKVH